MSQSDIEKSAHFASIFVLPFAGVVSQELQDYGLSKNKADEILLRSVKRFGVEMEKHPPNFTGSESSGWFDDFFKHFPPMSKVFEKALRITIQEIVSIIVKRNK